MTTDSIPPDAILQHKITLGLVTQPVRGVYRYYVVTTKPWDGIYRDWGLISNLVERTGSKYKSYDSWAIADDAYTKTKATDAFLDAFAGLSVGAGGGAAATPGPGRSRASAKTGSTSSPSPSASPSSSTARQPPTTPSRPSAATMYAGSPRGSRPRGGWPFYAIAKGHKTGVFDNPEEADLAVLRFPGALQAGFRLREQAEEWLSQNQQ